MRSRKNAAVPIITIIGIGAAVVSTGFAVWAPTATTRLDYNEAVAGAVVSGSVLVATNTTGNALQVDGGSVNLTLSSSVLTAQSQGYGIYLSMDAGQIILSTNTINAGAKYGVYVATQSAGTAIWITSNTIISTVTWSCSGCQQSKSVTIATVA